MTRKAIVLCISGFVLVGCASARVVDHPAAFAPNAEPAMRPAKQPQVATGRPFLLHLPGIGGTRSIDQSVVRGFVQGGFTGDVEIYDWTRGDVGIDALRGIERNRREAQRIADKLLARHRTEPSAKFYLTCHSGGAGLAVWALEDLPSDVPIQAIVFMSPALSPGYDLSRALRHVTGHAYVFSSLSDTFVLGYGTRIFGTIDGIKTDAAGRVGFTRPASGEPAQYDKLVSLPYNANWSRYHNLGDHVGGMTRAFSTNVLMPLLLSGILPPLPTLVPTTAPGNRLRLPIPATLPHLGGRTE